MAANVILPHIHYSDVAAAIAWLTRVFGFTEYYRYGGSMEQPSGAQMYLGKAFFQLSRSGPRSASPAGTGGRSTQSLTVFVEDVEAHFAKAKAEGARFFEEVHETVYGERQYGVFDLEGHPWLFSCHAKDLSPEDWGARIAVWPDWKES